MESWMAAGAALYGLVIGSFLNVVIFRLPRKRSIVSPGSRCPSCKKTIRWYDNVPVASYLVLRGKCRSCRKSIPLQYPLVELLTACLFAFTYARFGLDWTLVARDLPFIALLVAITFIDLEHRLIPDVLSLGGLALGLATSFLLPEDQWMDCFAGAFVGFGFFYAFAWIYQRITGRSGLGGGDIKFIATLGAFVGLSGVMATILLSSILGSLTGIIWALVVRERNVTRFAIPFGPFLACAALLYYLFGGPEWFRFMTPT